MEHDSATTLVDISEDQAVNAPQYVVGIGASAGGLEALELLFSAMPVQTGMAFVIVQHLSPDYKSMMAELLSRKTMIPIEVAEDQMLILANTIYLLPPKKEMIAANGKLYLTERENSDLINLPINTFFRSLAETYQDKSIAIILSGTGSDGSKSVPLVHDSGGFVIAQNPLSCKFDSMPDNAIKTHSVDLVASPEDIPAALMKYSTRTSKVEEHMFMQNFDAEVGEFSEILLLLHNRFNLDFTQYKPSTISRRLERRLAMQNTDNLRAYIDVLLSNHEELEALYYDLLIGVTQFFRDPTAFNSLRTLIPKLLEAFKDETEIRIWIAACATGQEAYSTSILLVEAMENHPAGNKPFKIFATDIHNKSIQTAAVGIYNEADLGELQEDCKTRFFTKLDNGKFQVNPEIRKPIVFAQHNLLKDPPFTRTHLVNCRNLLIYFNTAAQQRVLSLLTFSLMNQGLLFLGPSEAIGSHGSDFSVVDSTYRIFRKTRDSQRRLDLPLVVRDRSIRKQVFPAASPEDVSMSAKGRRAREMLLQRYVPASILIDESGSVLHVFGDAGTFLSMTPGAPSTNIRSMVNDQAKLVLSQMIHYVSKNHKPMVSRKVEGFSNHRAVDIEMNVLSKMPGDLDYITISLSESAVIKSIPTIPAESKSSRATTDDVALYTNSRIKELEDELQFTQESLQSTVEELETSNEELQASNEELMAANEELQSTNEELQSVNEELFTVNGEFQKKELERSELEADERSLIDESNVGILFLDEALRVRKMSPIAAQIFQLLESDYGRTISSIPGQLIKSIRDDIQTVLQTGKLIEREVEDEDSNVYLMRANLHARDEVARTDAANGVSLASGVIVTFTNVSKYRSLQNALERTQTRFNNALNAISDGYFEWTLGSDEIYFPQSLYLELGYTDELPTMDQLLGEHLKLFTDAVLQASKKDKGVTEILPIANQEGKIRWMMCKGRVLESAENTKEKFAGILLDFSRQKQAEDKWQRQAQNLQRSNQMLEQFAYIVSHDLKAPLRHIQSYLIFMQEAIDNKDTDAIQVEMQGLMRASNGLGELIDDIITYSRVNSEKKKFSTVSVDEILDSVINTLNPVIQDKNVSIERTSIPDLYGDKNLLSHLFQNLIGNSCKYSDKESPQICVSHELQNTECIISVQDNGIGFDEAFAERIFLPFQRLVTKDQYEGTGIGLSICKTVVEQHNGSISVTSSPGKGACFTVSLPTHQGGIDGF